MCSYRGRIGALCNLCTVNQNKNITRNPSIWRALHGSHSWRIGHIYLKRRRSVEPELCYSFKARPPDIASCMPPNPSSGFSCCIGESCPKCNPWSWGPYCGHSGGRRGRAKSKRKRERSSDCVRKVGDPRHPPNCDSVNALAEHVRGLLATDDQT